MSRTPFKLSVNTGVALAAELTAVIEQQTVRLAMHAVAIDTRQSCCLVWVKTDLIQLQMRLVTTGAGSQNISSAVSIRTGDIVDRWILGVDIAARMAIGTRDTYPRFGIQLVYSPRQ